MSSVGDDVDGTATDSRRRIRVFVVDDHAVIRQGLQASLQAPDIVVVGEAATVADAYTGIDENVDVAIVDVRLQDGSGVDLIRDLRSDYANLQCVIFTAFDDEEAFLQSAMAGAAGHMTKDAGPDEIVDAIRRVADGQSLISPDALAELRARAEPQLVEDRRLADLTAQERRVLELVARGLTNREIGAHLSLADKTVRNYVSNILAKVGMRNRTEMAAYVATLWGRRNAR